MEIRNCTEGGQLGATLTESHHRSRRGRRSMYEPAKLWFKAHGFKASIWETGECWITLPARTLGTH
jgi:hypothetical protein